MRTATRGGERGEAGTEAPTYSLVFPRGHWYEVAKALPIPAARSWKAIQMSAGVRVYGVPAVAMFISSVAGMADVPDGNLLYVCLHNPFIDPPLMEVRDLLQKGQSKGIALIVVLPPLTSFTEALGQDRAMRLVAGDRAQFVATFADFDHLLVRISAGVIPNVTLVFPLNGGDGESLEHNRVWQSCCQFLGRSNCIDLTAGRGGGGASPHRSGAPAAPPRAAEKRFHTGSVTGRQRPAEDRSHPPGASCHSDRPERARRRHGGGR